MENCKRFFFSNVYAMHLFLCIKCTFVHGNLQYIADCEPLCYTLSFNYISI